MATPVMWKGMIAAKTLPATVETILDAYEAPLMERLRERRQPLPGARELLAHLTRLGVPWAIATSGRAESAAPALSLLGVGDDVPVITRDLVPHAKPDPDLYLTALHRLDVSPPEAIAFEDSSNGVQAAKAAGLFCVAVPNPLTADLDLSEADLRLLSLDAMPLREVIKEASSVRKRRAR